MYCYYDGYYDSMIHSCRRNYGFSFMFVNRTNVQQSKNSALHWGEKQAEINMINT